MGATADPLAAASYNPDTEPLAHALALVLHGYHQALSRRERPETLHIEQTCLRALAPHAPAGEDLRSAHTYNLDTPSGRLAHAICWTLHSLLDNLAGRATPAVHVIAFAEKTLADDGRSAGQTGRT